MTTKEDANMPLTQTETTELNLGDGVYVILEKHDKRLHGHDKRLGEHDDLFEDHAAELKRHAESIRELKENSLRLENVVMSESRETRTTITNTNDGLQKLITELMTYKSSEAQLEYDYKNNENQLEYTYKTSKEQLNHNLKIAKWESYAKIIGILAGSGGILVYVFQSVFN